eukprot:g58440.t1
MDLQVMLEYWSPPYHPARSSSLLLIVLYKWIELFVSATPTSPLHAITIYISSHLPEGLNLLLANEVSAQLNLSIDDAQAIRPTDYMPLKPPSQQIVYETEFHLFETPLQVGDLQLATVSYDFRPTTLAKETSYPIVKFNKIIDRRPKL